MIGAAEARADACPILTFHMLGTPRSPLAFPPELFRDGLRQLAAKGYRTLDLVEAASLARTGAGFPQRSVVLTFDDAYASVHAEALPLLVELGWTATVFVTVGTIGLRSPEGWPVADLGALRELIAAGVSIGGHTISHPDLTKLTPAAIRLELEEGKTRLEELVGAPVRAFAYPFGGVDERSRNAAEELYDCACTDVLGTMKVGADPWLLPRLETWYLGRRWLFPHVGSRRVNAYLALRRGPRAARRALAHRHASSRGSGDARIDTSSGP